jgi:hypothetical protein
MLWNFWKKTAAESGISASGAKALIYKNYFQVLQLGGAAILIYRAVILAPPA